MVEEKLVDEMLDKFLKPENKALHSIRKGSVAAGLPAIEVSPQQGKFLTVLVQMCEAKRVLEIGTLGGYSTACLARGLNPYSTGKVVTLEYDPRHAEVAFDNLLRVGLIHLVEILVGDAKVTLEALHEPINAGIAEPFDFIFIDADKENNATYVRQCLPLSRSGTIIIVDNVVRSGRVLTQADKMDFIREIGANPRLSVAAIQTVGHKGWDGFVMARVK